MPNPTPVIRPYGDSAILIDFKARGYSAKIIDRIHGLMKALRKDTHWIEIVPAYDSLLVTFDPVSLPYAKAFTRVEKAISQISKSKSLTKPIDIPVVYGGTFGPDIERIAATTRLSIDEVIALHSQHVYRVCMMGFIPGFAFLSAAPKALHHARHSAPRLTTPSGSVGIAGWQTGIYGLESPGGWQIIGRTPVKTFDAKRENPFLLKAGDQVRFVPITDGSFDD